MVRTPPSLPPPPLETAGVEAGWDIRQGPAFVLSTGHGSFASKGVTVRQTRWQFESDDARAAHATRRSFVAFATTALGEATVDLASAELVLGELIGNVKRYAPGRVVVEAAWEREAVRITVRDTGSGFIEGIAMRPADLLAESGRGLYLVSALASDIEVTTHQGGGCAVTATIPLSLE